MNDNVIITGNSHSENSTYHTTVCRKVWQISRKQYVTETDAEARGYEECAYCTGDFEVQSGSKALYYQLEQRGKRRAEAD
jgi:hypothetical protein